MVELQYFNPNEFRHYFEMDITLLKTLDFVRSQVGVPFRITSDFRPGDGGLHGQGAAVDWTTEVSRNRARYSYQEQMWRVSGAVHTATRRGITKDRSVQLEFVQGPTDWHFHLGLYSEGSYFKSKIVIALD